MDKQLLIAMAHKMPIKAKWLKGHSEPAIEVEILNQRTADWDKGWFLVRLPNGQRRFAHSSTLTVEPAKLPPQDDSEPEPPIDFSKGYVATSRCLPFDRLLPEQQENAKRIFFDARPGDGKHYFLNMDGAILYRRRISNVA